MNSPHAHCVRCPPAGHPCEQGEAKARRARLRARVAADATMQRIGHDIAEAARSALRAAVRALLSVTQTLAQPGALADNRVLT